MAQKLHRQNVINVQSGGMDPPQNPKPTSFVENLLGNETPVTIDTHNFRMLGMASKDPRFLATSTPEGDFNPRKAYESGNLTVDEALNHPVYWESAPNKNEYGAYEAYQQKLAKKMGRRQPSCRRRCGSELAMTRASGAIKRRSCAL